MATKCKDCYFFRHGSKKDPGMKCLAGKKEQNSHPLVCNMRRENRECGRDAVLFKALPTSKLGKVFRVIRLSFA